MKKIITTLLSIVTMNLIMGINLASAKLVTPEIPSLPGAGLARQQDPGGVMKWFVETILANWTIAIISFVGGLAFVMLVVSGIRYLTAYGNEETATSARKMIMYSIAGLVLALFSYTIVKIIINIDFLGS